MILENQSLHLENERLRTEVAGLKAERDAARAEIELARRILCLPLDQTEAEVASLEPGKTPMACRLLDLANLKSSHQAGVRLNNERRAEIARLEGENQSLREAGRQAEAEVERLRGVLQRSCNDHIALAGQYEAAGNTRGAMRLRAVGNLLGVILQGGTPTTVCPPVVSGEVD